MSRRALDLSPDPGPTLTSLDDCLSRIEELRETAGWRGLATVPNLAASAAILVPELELGIAEGASRDALAHSAAELALIGLQMLSALDGDPIARLGWALARLQSAASSGSEA